MKGKNLDPRLKRFGAEEGTRTPTGVTPLDPESSASTNSATSAFSSKILDSISFVKVPIFFISPKMPLGKQFGKHLRNDSQNKPSDIWLIP